MREEYQRWASCRTASTRAMPATSRASATTSPGSPDCGGSVPMPSSMIFLKISGWATASTAATTMRPRNQDSSRRYGAANRTIRRAVPGASRVSLTLGSRRKDRIMDICATSCTGASSAGPGAARRR